MSHAQDIAQHCTAICVAAIGLSATTGAVTIGAVGLAAAGFQIFKSNQAKCAGAVKRILRDIQNSGTESPAVLAEAWQLIANSNETLTIDRVDLPKAADSKDFRDAVIDQLMKTFPDSASYNATRLLRLAMEAAFEACRYEDEFHRPLTQDMLAYISGNTDELRRGQAAVLAALAEINAQAKRVSEEERAAWEAREERLIEKAEAHAKELHVNTGLLLALARRYAEDSASDFDSALRGLERALDVAAQRPKGTNLGEEVDSIIAEVDRLNNAGQVAEGTDALKQAMATRRDKIEQEKAAMLSLLNKGIAQAVMERSAGDAAACEVEKIEIEVHDQKARFDALRSVQDQWYERGRDKGLNFDLEVSIKLTHASVENATDPDQTGTALNDLGISLLTLGERESGTDRVEQAITAYRAALKERTREKVPLDWAMTQSNLGNALKTLGTRESGTERLGEAVIAYSAALEEWTRESVPLGWAATQNNLGNALTTLGSRETGTERLEQAVIAYRDALEELTREKVPMDWAMTQNNLGSALQALGERSGTERLEQAVTAYRAALEEWTREKVPLDWAMTHNNLGNALKALGSLESGTARLEQAVIAYRDALEELTREKVPLGWAMTQNNLGNALQALGERSGTERLEQAVTAYRAALEERTREKVPLDWAMTQNNLGTALGTLGERESGTERLEQAVIAFRAALEERTPEKMPLGWAMTLLNLGIVEATFFEKNGDPAHLDRAEAHVRGAREVFAEGKATQYLGMADRELRNINTLRNGSPA